MTDTPRKFPPGSPFEAYAHLIPTVPPLHVLPWPKERPQPSPGCLSDAEVDAFDALRDRTPAKATDLP